MKLARKNMDLFPFVKRAFFLARKTYCTGSMILKSDTHPDLAFELLLISDCYAQLRLLDLGQQYFRKLLVPAERMNGVGRSCNEPSTPRTS